MSIHWSREFWLLGAIVAVSVLLGWLLDLIPWVLVAALLLYLEWHFFNIRLLQRWLAHGRKFQPPGSHGIWGEVYEQIFQLQKRHRSRKQRLKAYLSRFRESTAAMPDATVVLTDNGVIEWWNGAADVLLGLTAPQDKKQRIANLLRAPAFKDYFDSGDYQDSIEMASPVNDAMTLNVRIVPYGKGQCLLLARDITHIQRLEQMRGDFVANVSHELRTPLTVLKGFLETMADSEATLPKGWARSLQLMQEQSDRMEDIVEDLLLLSRLELDANTEDFQPVKVGTMVGNIVKAAVVLGEDKHLDISIEVDESLTVSGMADELSSAFSNLIFNAVRYTPPGQKISVRWYEDKQGKHFLVEDTGEGIEPHHIERLTERFYRVDVGRSRQHGGTGLGLAIVKHVLNRHHGELVISSTVGKGSAFRCDFPAEHRPLLAD